MKNLLIAFTLLLFASCTTEVAHVESTQVTYLKNKNAYDTVLLVRTDSKMYFYKNDSTKTFIGKVDTENVKTTDSNLTDIGKLLLILLFVICFLILIL